MKFSSFARALASTALLTASLFSSSAVAIDVDPTNQDSLFAATQEVALKLRALYPDKESWFVAGEFGLIQTADGKNNKGYYWWEAGAAMGAWIEYWHYTGDDQFNDIVTTALLNQVGEDDNYEPSAQTLSLGNDDQAFWALAVLSAAERVFPNPPSDKPQWLTLAMAVFNRQASRWDELNCGGGLRWQVVSTNAGYDYKNAISNGLFFQMGARLARYTGNATYAEWAEKVYDWSKASGIISSDYKVYDGSHIPTDTNGDGMEPDCPVTEVLQWSYNAGVYLAGAAFMYNYTDGGAKWQNETNNIMQAIQSPFFTSDFIMRESACDPAPSDKTPTCNTDQRSFKAYLSRFMAYTYQMAPFTQSWILPRLQASAVAAAATCNGGTDGKVCGLAWVKKTYDDSPYGIAIGGLGEHLSVMEVLQANFITTADPPVTNNTGGTSVGDPTAGTGTSSLESKLQTDPSTTGDKAGAGILTAIVLGLLLSLTYWLLRG
ncbi:glycosyl hydrolase family 76-domain-containing protein [Morchella snyderi]|nr:glycosyl hydrolase family 76-domain-containing protein [Morchella snyderi]